MRCSTTTSAAAMAASTSPPATSHSNATLPGASWWSCGTPSEVASAAFTTTGSVSYSTSTASAASAATSGEEATTAATMSPTNRTVSMAIGGCATSLVSGTTQPHGTEPCSSFTCSPVNTPTTPSRASAAEVSIPVMRAWACGLLTSWRCSMPGSLMSSTYLPVPWIRRGSSRLFTLEPNREVVIGSSSESALSDPPQGHRRPPGRVALVL